MNSNRFYVYQVTKSKQRWYNNGIETRIFELGKELPGFVPGCGILKD